MKAAVLAIAFATTPILASPGSHIIARPRFEAQGTAPASAAVAGHWSMELATPHGKMTLALELKLEGKKVTGSLTGEAMGAFPVAGEYADGKLAFSVTGAPSEMTFNGRLKDADTLVGDLSSHTGDLVCVATRVKNKKE